MIIRFYTCGVHAVSVHTKFYWIYKFSVSCYTDNIILIVYIHLGKYNTRIFSFTCGFRHLDPTVYKGTFAYW